MIAAAHLAVNALAVLAVLLYVRSGPRLLKSGSVLLAAIALAFPLVHYAGTVAHSIESPPLYDTQCFWLYGRAAVLEHAPYDPRAMHRVASGLSLGRGFEREVLDVGFVYPPPTTALVAPLGLFPSPRSAAPYWYALLLAALCAEILLLYLRYLRADGWAGLLAAAMIVLLLSTTQPALTSGQPIVIAEMFLLLCLASGPRWLQGMWLAFAAIAKPFVAIVFLYAFVRRKWSVLLSGVVTCAAVTIGVLPIIGWHSIASYVHDPPTSRWPSYLLHNEGNISILSTMLQWAHSSPPVGVALHEPQYLAICAVLVIVTLWGVKDTRVDRDWAAMSLLMLALLIYPISGWTYTTMISLPICLVWSRRETLPFGTVLAFALTMIEFAVVDVAGAEIIGVAVAWCAMLMLPYLQTRSPLQNAAAAQ